VVSFGFGYGGRSHTAILAIILVSVSKSWRLSKEVAVVAAVVTAALIAAVLVLGRLQLQRGLLS
jgi:hypothetical protein